MNSDPFLSIILFPSVPIHKLHLETTLLPSNSSCCMQVFQEASMLLLGGMFNLHGFAENNLVHFYKIPITTSKIADRPDQIQEQNSKRILGLHQCCVD